MKSHNFSIRTKLLIGILPVGLGVILALSVLSYLRLRAFALSELQNSVSSAGLLLAEDVERQLEQRVNDLVTLAQNPLFADYQNNRGYGLQQEAEVTREALEAFLAGFARRSKVYGDIVYLNPDGRLVFRIIDGDPIKITPGTKIEDAYFKRASRLSPEAYAVSALPEKGPHGNPMIYFSKPALASSSDPAGILVLGYSISSLEARLEGRRLGDFWWFYIADAQEQTIAGRRPEGKNFMTASLGLKGGWRAHALLSPDYYLAPLRKIRNLSLLILTLTALGSGVLVIAVVGRVTKPVRGLLKGTKELAGGNLEYRVPEEGSLELASLAGAFNEMADKIKEREENQKHLQDQLIQTEKLSAVGQLISSIAHELNNPLAGVTGYAELIQEEKVSDSLRQDLKQLYTHAMRCRGIIDNLLLFVRQGKHERKRFDLNEAARTVLSLLEYRMRRAENIAIELAPLEGGAYVDGDFQQMQQVLINLVQNAADALREQATNAQRAISIKIERAGSGRLSLSIRDNGPGISAEHLTKIFQPFFTTKGAGRGTGLGLSIVRQIVEEHEGNIVCKNRAGEGTEFLMDFPPSVSTGELALAEGFEPTGRARLILVVDDEEYIGSMASRMLERLGHRTEKAAGVEAAMEMIKARAYDLMLLDLEMPGLDGKDLYEWLAKSNAGMARKILFMTGDTLSPRSMEFFKRHQVPYLAKPFDIRQLHQAVEAFQA